MDRISRTHPRYVITFGHALGELALALTVQIAEGVQYRIPCGVVDLRSKQAAAHDLEALDSCDWLPDGFDAPDVICQCFERGLAAFAADLHIGFGNRDKQHRVARTLDGL